MLRIPESEFTIDTARSSGAGGQNVNKVETKVQLRWNIGNSRVLSYEEKEMLRTGLENRINLEDELMIDVSEERSQAENRRIAIERLHAIVGAALKPRKLRTPTRRTKASKERRLTAKKITGERKRSRKDVWEE